MPCANVSERHQISAIDVTVSQCHDTIQNNKLPRSASGSPQLDARGPASAAGSAASAAIASAAVALLTEATLAEALDDIGSHQIGHRQGKAAPHRDECLIFRIQRVVIRYGFGAHEPILIVERFRLEAPILL